MCDDHDMKGLRNVFRTAKAARPDSIRELRNGNGLTVRLLDSGTIHSIHSSDVPITLYSGSALEGGPTNLYLRVLSEGCVRDWAPLLGGPATDVSFAADHMVARGVFAGIAYSVELRLPQQSGWSWSVVLRNETSAEIACDVVYVQDVGMSNAGNEAYISQYVDHTVLEHPDLGYVLCARQNLPQKGQHPWLMLGCHQGCRGFVTDGFDFYGCDHRVTRRPVALDQAVLPSVRRQYEFSVCVLQSEPARIGAGQDATIGFFAVFEPDHPEPTSSEDLQACSGRVIASSHATEDAITGALQTGGSPSTLRIPHDSENTPPASVSPPSQSQFVTAPLLNSDDLSDAQLSEHWGDERRHAETDSAGTLLSFFMEDSRHVVLKAKERIQERPTGAVLRSGTGLVNERGIVSTTAYMRGVFVSHLALGNLSMNVALGIRRDPLGALLAGGLRVFIRRGNGFELLGVPSAFENGLNGCRWLYCSGDDVIDVRTCAATAKHAVYLEIHSRIPRRLRVAVDIVMGPPGAEPLLSEAMDVGERAITLRPSEGTRFRDLNPGAFVQVVPDNPGKLSQVGADELLFADGASRGAPCLVMDTDEVERFGLGFTGALDAETAVPDPDALFGEPATFERELARGRSAYSSLTSGFALAAEDQRVARIETIVPWFVQNAVVHLSVPHGLEQYLGAAWGTRDVCQGPLEMLLALGREPEAREILTIVFANQHVDGGWPQWFMFDNNSDIRAGDAHGDVVFWPVKALCEYVEATGDAALLDEALPYHGTDTPVETVFEHVSRALDNIRDALVPGTSLVAYGHGDWNDSLQPADPTLAEQMVSSWTVGLCFQTVSSLARVCALAGRADTATTLKQLAADVRRDFNARLVHDDVVCGFGLLEDDQTATPLLHPSDTRTGIHYRLLPMIRGIISGIFTPDQAQQHADLIKRHLLCPDGARLMDRPPKYDGGRQRIFQRGETSTFFGREIGIMYVHAHIRYAEAMARLGRAEELLDALMAVIPIDIDQTVPNAVSRQRNAYFSSSDAAFTDRHQADREYDRVKAGTIPVKGGWRIYSSGPGLWVSLLIRHLLGLRRQHNTYVFDPVLAPQLHGLVCSTHIDGVPVRVVYELGDRRFGPDVVEVNGKRLTASREANPYRTGGLAVPLAELAEALESAGNEIIVR